MNIILIILIIIMNIIMITIIIFIIARHPRVGNDSTAHGCMLCVCSSTRLSMPRRRCFKHRGEKSPTRSGEQGEEAEGLGRTHRQEGRDPGPN